MMAFPFSWFFICIPERYTSLQHVELVPEMDKQRRLEQILRSQEPGSKVIIFCSTKKLCDQLARSIGRNFGAAAIHGDKSQGERDWVLNQFRAGRSPVLVATDVAARGLDIRDIRLGTLLLFYCILMFMKVESLGYVIGLNIFFLNS